MAEGFGRWEADPLFSAAEVVQDSADRSLSIPLYLSDLCDKFGSCLFCFSKLSIAAISPQDIFFSFSNLSSVVCTPQLFHFIAEFLLSYIIKAIHSLQVHLLRVCRADISFLQEIFRCCEL